MISKSLVNDVLDTALSTGGDFAEIFLENTLRNNISMINGSVDKALSGIDFGVGIRIFTGYNAIYAYTNDIEPENFLKVAKQAAAAIKSNNKSVVLNFMDYNVTNIHPIKILPSTINKKEVVNLLREASASSFAYDSLITQTTENYADVTQDILIANSEGLWITDRRVRSRVYVSAVASNESEKQTGSFGPGAHKGFELFNSLNMKELGENAAKTAVTMLKADLCPSGRMPVILGNGFGGVIFHEACAHGLEATSVAKGASVFCNKKGKQIASTKITAIDDGTIPNEWGSLNIDDEGTKTQKNILIENGILKSYLVDRLNGMKMGEKSTGSSRRESYKYAPTSRMTNTYIAAGNDKIEDIFKNTVYGLYAKKMGGGSVQTATGEFNFAVTEAYLIRNGKIAEPVRGATLIGKGSEVLMDIDMVSDNLAQDQGICGSISGSVPTNVGQPTLRVKQITVGGRS